MLTDKLSSFLVIITSLTVFLLATSLGLVYVDVYEAVYGMIIVYSLLFFLVLSSLTYYILIRTLIKGGSKKFIRGVMASNVIKLLLSILFVVFLLYYFQENQISAALIFFASYFLYTVLVLIFLFSNLRQISEPHTNAK